MRRRKQRSSTRSAAAAAGESADEEDEEDDIVTENLIRTAVKIWRWIATQTTFGGACSPEAASGGADEEGTRLSNWADSLQEVIGAART